MLWFQEGVLWLGRVLVLGPGVILLWEPVNIVLGCPCVSLVLGKWRRITRLVTRTKEISNAASVLVENHSEYF